MTNLLITKMDTKLPVCVSSTNGHILPFKSPTESKFFAFKIYYAIYLNFSNLIIRSIFDFWHLFRKLSMTESIIRNRCIHSKRFMRPFSVINVTPPIKQRLTLLNRFIFTVIDNFRFQDCPLYKQ